MSKKREVFLAVLLVTLTTITLISFSGAIVYQGSPFFELTQEGFGPGQTLEGILNFSLYEEPANTIVSGAISSNKKEMKLLDFLNEANAVFNCEPEDCEIIYSSSNKESTKSASLNEGDRAYYGMVISGENIEFNNLSFSMIGPMSNTESICYETPLKFDLLDDNVIDYEYKEVSDEWCGDRKKGDCFSVGSGLDDAYFDKNVPFCQKIWIEKTGKIKVEGYMKVDSLGNLEGNDIVFSIYDLDGNKKEDCKVEWFGSTNYDYAECSIPEELDEEEFYIDEADYYYVCARVVTDAASDISIKSEAQGDICGFSGTIPPQTFNSDFALYVQEAKFAPITTELVFDETTALGESIVDSVQNYINDKYEANCTGEGCIIPLKLVSLADQDIVLQDPYLKFRSSGILKTNNNFYDLDIVWPKIDMDVQKMDFSVLNISVPQQPGTYSVIARVGIKSKSQSFKVESVPIIQSVSPTIVIPGKATEFNVLASAPAGRNIVEYIWDFGDNTGEQTTTESKIIHTYNEIKTYTLTIKAKDDLDLIGSRSFSVTSNITKELLNITIHNLRARLDGFTYQYEALDSWYQDLILINVSDVNEKLDEFESEIETATQSTLIDIKTELDLLNIPLSINDTITLLDSSYITNLEKIKLDYISTITQKSYNSDLKSQYQNAIALWQEDNINLRINGQTKSLIYDDRIEDVFTLINIRLDPYNSGNTSQTYFIFHLPSGINYNNIRTSSDADEQSDLDDAIAFIFYDLSSSEVISIALPGKHDFSNFVFYTSPSLSELQVEGGGEIIPGTGKKTPYFLAIILFLLLILAVSIALWLIWRGKGKGKKKLFSNSGDLYNLISVISSSQAAGLSKQQIIEQLQRNGWTKKQIDYAFKKMKKQPTTSRGRGRPTRPSSLRGFGYRR